MAVSRAAISSPVPGLPVSCRRYTEYRIRGLIDEERVERTYDSVEDDLAFEGGELVAHVVQIVWDMG